MSSSVKLKDPVLDSVRVEARTVSAVSWGYLALGMTWVIYGMFVLSYRVGSLAAVAALAGVAFLLGGISHLVVARQIDRSRWLYVLSGVFAVAAGIVAFAWPGATLYVLSLLVAWYLVVFGVIHLTVALAGPKVPLWWTQLLLGITELVLGGWAVRSWEHSLVVLVTLVGAWAVCSGVSEMVAAFSLRQAAKRTERLVG